MEFSLLEEFKRSWLTSLIGIILFFAGIWLLTWNEGRAVHHAHSLDEAYTNIIALNPYETVHKELDERLIHINGVIVIDEPLTELDYGISIQSVKVKRRVQMYQWVEDRIQRDYSDSTNMMSNDNADYYYTTEWRDKLVDSQNFYIRHGHQNPDKIPLRSQIQISPLVRVGQLIVGTDLKDKFDDYIEMTSDERPERREIKLHMGIYYHCEDVWNPKVGDIRVQFYYAGVSGESVSIIAMQKDGILIPYITSKGHEILLLRTGTRTISQMFSEERSDAYYETWKLRGAGIFVLYASFVMLARLSKIFLLRFSLFQWLTTQEMTSSTNLAISVSISLLVIATAWFLYRPWLGAALLMAAISPFLYCTMGDYNAVPHQY